MAKKNNKQQNLNKHNRLTVVLLVLVLTTFAQAQNLIKNATAPVSFSKSDFADTIKIKVMDGAVVIPVEIEGKTRNLLFDTGSPLGLWFGQKEDWMKQVTADSLVFGDINNKSRQQVIYQGRSGECGSLTSSDLITLHEVFKSDATDVILQHSLIVKWLRVAKWWQNGKISLNTRLNGLFFA